MAPRSRNTGNGLAAAGYGVSSTASSSSVSLSSQLDRGPPFTLANTKESYRDLLIFEERLKQNAARLATQRRKYEAFLTSLVLSTLLLAYKVLLRPSPYTLIQFILYGLLLVALVTLILFFATGVYSEKIAYAYKFVPQANRALRYFNIYLNTKRNPTQWPFNPFRSPTSRLQSASTEASPGGSGNSSLASSARSSRSASPISVKSAASYRARAHGATSAPPSGRNAVALAPLPPSSNPRGELVFSSRVTPAFREGYERYRAEWERRRKPPPVKPGWLNKIFTTPAPSRSASPAPVSREKSPIVHSATLDAAPVVRKNRSARSLPSYEQMSSLDQGEASSSYTPAASSGELSDSSIDRVRPDSDADADSDTQLQTRGRDIRRRTISLTRMPISEPASANGSPKYKVVSNRSSMSGSRSPSPLRAGHLANASTTSSPGSSPGQSRVNLPGLVLEEGRDDSTGNAHGLHYGLGSMSEMSSPSRSPSSESPLSTSPGTFSLSRSGSERGRRRYNLTSASESSLATSVGSGFEQDRKYEDEGRVADTA